MPRNPFSTPEGALQALQNILLDDGPVDSLLFDQERDILGSQGYGSAFGFFGGGDPGDFIEVFLYQKNNYNFTAGADFDLSIFVVDSEGYLLVSRTSEDLGLGPDPFGFTQIWNFRPDYDGVHYIFVGPDASSSPSSSYLVGAYVYPDYNLPPMASPDEVVLRQGEAAEIDVLINDNDPDSDFIALVDVDDPEHGSVEMGENGDLIYLPDPGFSGFDTIFYKIRDASFDTAEGRVDVRVERNPDIGLGLSKQEARELALLYEAGLNRNGRIDNGGLNYWIDQREEGLGLRAVSNFFLNSNEFTQAFGDVDTLSDLDFVQQLYRNVLDREGEQRGVDFWLGELALPQVTRADVLISFARSPENVANSGFVEDLAEVSPGVWDFV